MSELASKIGVKSACEVLNVPRSRVYRQRKPQAEPARVQSPLMGCQALSEMPCAMCLTVSASWIKRRVRCMRLCWTKGCICAIGAACSASFTAITKSVNVAASVATPPTKSLNCWQKLPTKSGHGTSPTCAAR